MDPTKWTYRGVSAVQRFWKQVEMGKPDECWIWKGYVNHPPLLPYGAMQICGRCYQVHRFSWLLHKGNIPDGLCVLHRCDNASCVNPNHLWLGTRIENNKDCHNKGRNKYVSGELVGTSKLTREQVMQIRKAYAETPITMTALGEKFGISQPMVRNIVKGRWWKQVGGPITDPRKKDRCFGFRGEKHRSAKLTEANVKTIRLLHAIDTSTEKLALTFGVSKSAITNVVSGASWSHIS